MREFVLKEMPEIWNVIVERRAEVAGMRTGLIDMRKLLKDSGKVPESDMQYVEGRKKYDVERMLLEKAFVAIEKAYLSVRKCDIIVSGKDVHLERRKAIDECVREILGAIENGDDSVSSSRCRVGG